MINNSRMGWLFIAAMFVPFLMTAGVSPKNRVSNADTSTDSIIRYSPAPFQPIKVLFDYYHHALPSTKVGNYIVTSSWVDDNGRYGWNDFVHTNTFDHAYVILEDDYQVSMSRKAYSKKLLSETDAVVIINVDDPKLIPDAQKLTDEEITLLQKFVEDGGSLMVMLNAGSPSRTNESFEREQLKKLVRRFGLDWNEVDTHYSDNIIPEGHPYFYDVPMFHYGAGCTLNILPEAEKPEVLLDVYSDSTYTDRDVRGHGIVMVRPGKGKFLLVGDRGSWTGNLSRPWVDDVTFFKQMFLYMKPDQQVAPHRFKEGEILNYEVEISGLEAVPVANSLSQIALPHYKVYTPREITNMPYFERSANLELTCKAVTEGQAAKMEAKITDFKWFDEQPADAGQLVSFTVSHQGKVSGLESSGLDAQWLAPDIPSMIALLPVDGLRPGDHWYSIETLRVPILRGSDLPPAKPFNMQIKYVCDTRMEGKNCRLLRSSGEIWLDELGVTIEDLLPLETLRQTGGSPYRFFYPHGGKLLFKEEQWVDASTGIVLKAANQIRIIAWIQDTRKPAPARNADKDNEMIVSIAYLVNLKLK
ncbi:MAG: hypothetical protein LBN71_05660 [Tannerella sp.]|jgi:hypothetical protein|nr:hypothetical protein [Tannerella sp.]